ncbi:hypothetical protein ACT2E5_05615 [Burkholderia vietnamiensis]|uniref:hypothetical protein n=1 Tax=Burkholderia vietnamiensis TaxID=60552 RepID=UPI00402A6BEF
MTNANPALSALPARIPGISMLYDEDSNFRYALLLDLSKFEPAKYDRDALFERFSNRLMSEYERLESHIEAARAVGDLPVDFHRILTHRGCGYFLGLIYVANPRLSRYSMGLR